MNLPTRSGRVWGEPIRGLTRARHRILIAIREWRLSHSYGPSIRDISVATNNYENNVYQLLERLRRDGLVESDRGIARSLQITDAGHQALLEWEKTQ